MAFRKEYKSYALAGCSALSETALELIPTVQPGQKITLTFCSFRGIGLAQFGSFEFRVTSGSNSRTYIIGYQGKAAATDVISECSVPWVLYPGEKFVMDAGLMAPTDNWQYTVHWTEEWLDEIALQEVPLSCGVLDRLTGRC